MKAKSNTAAPAFSAEPKSTQTLRFLVVSGPKFHNAGKTTLCDNLFAPRLENVFRMEVESNSESCSVKPGVKQCQVSDFVDIAGRLTQHRNRNVLVDVGETGYESFLGGFCEQFARITNYFDRVIFVIGNDPNSKEHLVLKALMDVLGRDIIQPDKLSVLFNYGQIAKGNPNAAMDKIHDDFEGVFELAASKGFHICSTPVYSHPMYKAMSKNPEWDVHKLAHSKDKSEEAILIYDDVEKLTPERLAKADALMAESNTQTEARNVYDRNLDRVFDEVMDVTLKTIAKNAD